MLKRVKKDKYTNTVKYNYIENKKVLGTIWIQVEKEWVYIYYVQVYDRGKGVGTRMMTDVYHTLPYKKYYGDCTYQNSFFWKKVGATFKYELEPSEDFYTFEVVVRK